MEDLQLCQDANSPDRPAAGRRGGPGSTGRAASGRVWGAPLAALAALAAFVPVVGNGWVDWDDQSNFLQNPAFRGLGWPQIRWAWTTTHVGVYQPLSWMVFEAEYVAWGLAPRGYHVVSLLLHAAVAALLYVTSVRLLTLGGYGRGAGLPRGHVRIGCALAAALWAAHPLQTEVVAWVSCQPYLPCALFSLLSVLVYVRAAESPAADPRRTALLLVAWVLLAMALLFHAVALGVVPALMILDAYPLRRLGGRNGWLGPSARRVWWEKLPFLALALVIAVQAVRAKWSEDGQFLPDTAGHAPRIDLAAYNAWFCLSKLFWPRHLIKLYEAPERVGLLEPPFAAALLIVFGISLAAWLARNRYPGVLAAWLAYLVLLAPNSGLFQYTVLLAADRYGYLSTMPLVFLLAAALARSMEPGRLPRLMAVPARAAVLALVGVLAILSWSQASTWYDSEALWRHAVAHAPGRSDIVHNILGSVLARKGRIDEAMAHYAEAIRQNPANSRAHLNVGAQMARRGGFDEAIAEFREVVRLDPSSWEAHQNLGLALAREGKYVEAIVEFSRASEIRPDYAEARSNWASALALQGRYAEAIPLYTEALRLKPGLMEARRNLDRALAKTSQLGVRQVFDPRQTHPPTGRPWAQLGSTSVPGRSNLDQRADAVPTHGQGSSNAFEMTRQ